MPNALDRVAEEMPFTVVLNVPKSMVESVTTKLNKV